jgi:hypothetical protein
MGRGTANARTEWVPKYVGPGLFERAADISCVIGREDFRARFKSEQKGQLFYIPDSVIDGLYKKVRRGLQLLKALPAARVQIASADWQMQKKLIVQLKKELSAMEQTLSSHSIKSNLPLTKALAGSISIGVKSFCLDLRRELELASRLVKHEEDIVSGYLKPTVASQILVELEGYLIRSVPKLNKEERLSVLNACSVAAGMADEKQLISDEAIGGRLYRARHSYKRDARKGNWHIQE